MNNVNYILHETLNSDLRKVVTYYHVNIYRFWTSSKLGLVNKIEYQIIILNHTGAATYLGTKNNF